MEFGEIKTISFQHFSFVCSLLAKFKREEFCAKNNIKKDSQRKWHY